MTFSGFCRHSGDLAPAIVPLEPWFGERGGEHCCCGVSIHSPLSRPFLPPQTTMPGMKRDCGGAAAVLGAFRAAVKQVRGALSSSLVLLPRAP